MCGIICAINTGKNEPDVNRSVIDQLQNQLSRGAKGFGFVKFDKGKEIEHYRSTEICETLINLHYYDSKAIMLHHRAPTSSDNKLQQTHPIVVDNKELKHIYYVVHNGIIQNDDERKEAHEKLGYEYTTETVSVWTSGSTYVRFNDSESIAIDLARFIEGKSQKIEACGSAAVVALQVSRTTGKALRLFYGRNSGNPLNLAMNRRMFFLSSEGIGDRLVDDKLYTLDLKDMSTKSRVMRIATVKTVTTTTTSKKDTKNKPTVPSVFQKGQEIGFLTEDKKEKDDNDYSHYDYPRHYALSAWDDEIEKATDILQDFNSRLDDYQSFCHLVSSDSVDDLIEDTVKNIRDRLKTAYKAAEQEWLTEYYKKEEVCATQKGTKS